MPSSLFAISFGKLKKADQRISLEYSTSKPHYRRIPNSDVLAAVLPLQETLISLVAVGLAYKAPRLNRRFQFQ